MASFVKFLQQSEMKKVGNRAEIFEQEFQTSAGHYVHCITYATILSTNLQLRSIRR